MKTNNTHPNTPAKAAALSAPVMDIAAEFLTALLARLGKKAMGQLSEAELANHFDWWLAARIEQTERDMNDPEFKERVRLAVG